MKVTNLFSGNVASIFACLTILTLLSGCDSKDATPNPITVTDSKQLEQTVYADRTSGASAVNITTAGTWTSTITKKAQTKDAADAPDWISISPDRGDRAGTYNISITLTPNYTGAERAAVITVFCMGAEVAVTVTQRATKEDGTEHEWFNRTITGHIVDGGNSTVKLKAESENGAVELVTAPCSNGNFTITLPKTVESGLLYGLDDDEVAGTVQISDRGTRSLDVFWTLDNDGLVLVSADEKVSATLIYVDRDCNITGYGMEDSVRIDFNMELKAGWNWAYGIENNNGNMNLTTAKPDAELQWLVEVRMPEPFNPVISGHIVNGSNVTELQLVVESSAQAESGIIELAATTCQNGYFTIILPDTVESRLLYLEGNLPSTAQTSENSFRLLDLPWFTSNAGFVQLLSADGKTEAKLQYIDRDVAVTGYHEDAVYRVEYDMDLKAGWNWIYITAKNATTDIFSTTRPDVELRWELESSTRRSKKLRIKN